MAHGVLFFFFFFFKHIVCTTRLILIQTGRVTGMSCFIRSVKSEPLGLGNLEEQTHTCEVPW